MQCPFCKAHETKVVDSRLGNDGLQVRRRRECISCQGRFTTYETIELSLPRLIKQDGSYVQFKEEKLRGGIMRALEKRKVSIDEIDAMVSRIMQHIQASGEREISTEKVGELVMDELKLVDHVGYVRFASVYRRFENIDEFSQEVEKLKDKVLA